MRHLQTYQFVPLCPHFSIMHLAVSTMPICLPTQPPLLSQPVLYLEPNVTHWPLIRRWFFSFVFFPPLCPRDPLQSCTRRRRAAWPVRSSAPNSAPNSAHFLPSGPQIGKTLNCQQPVSPAPQSSFAPKHHRLLGGPEASFSRPVVRLPAQKPAVSIPYM